MTWAELKTAIDALLLAHDLPESIVVRLDTEPDQDIMSIGISTRFDGEKSITLSPIDYVAEEKAALEEWNQRRRKS